MESKLFVLVIIFAVITSMGINDYYIDKSSSVVLLSNAILGFVTVVSLFSSKINQISSKIPIFLLGIFIVSAIGYSIYQWKQLTEDDTNEECGFLLPSSDQFSGEVEGEYNLYRILYLGTLIVIVSLLQFKVDGTNFTLYGVPAKLLSVFLFLTPIILPLLTEMVDLSMNMVFPDDLKSNPESLLSNFVLGVSKLPGSDDGFNVRMIFPIIFYLLLMFITIDSSYGITSFWGTQNADTGGLSIKIAIFFVIFFPFIMRTIFVQDCSLESDKNISKTDDESVNLWDRSLCVVEKYGGVQTLMCISLIILLIYNINNPIYKILFFLIICLGSWALSATYMLSIDGEDDDE